jgi:methyl-accepting chemotaxis protein
MSEINQSSRRIADIIGVIDDIAFQTNLLALNAAVEAARAGEQGRGFAVVASEVRTLASRSAESAREIKGLIKDSVGKVDNGSQLVDESGRTLGEIVSSVKRMTDLIAEITAASREQATGVEEVNRAVTQMDQVTTQNASLVDEASSAATALSGQATTLAELIAFFDLGAAARRRAAAVPAVAAAKSAAPGRPAAATPLRRPVAKAAPVRTVNGGDDDWDSI